MTIVFNIVRLASLLCLLSSCATETHQPAMHDFGQMQVPEWQSSLAKHSITVNAPTWLWDNRIRYRLLYNSATRVRFYTLDFWVASPPELFEQLLNNSLESAHYSVTLQLLQFEQLFDSPNQARCVLNFLVDVYDPEHKNKVASKRFNLEQTTATGDAKGAITSFTVLTRLAVEQIQRWLRLLPPASQ